MAEVLASRIVIGNNLFPFKSSNESIPRNICKSYLVNRRTKMHRVHRISNSSHSGSSRAFCDLGFFSNVLRWRTRIRLHCHSFRIPGPIKQARYFKCLGINENLMLISPLLIFLQKRYCCIPAGTSLLSELVAVWNCRKDCFSPFTLVFLTMITVEIYAWFREDRMLVY